MPKHNIMSIKTINASQVPVFWDGHVAEYGTHAELYAKGGIYTEMFDKQAQFYRDAPQENDNTVTESWQITDYE